MLASAFASIGARIRVGFAVLLMIMIAVAITALSAASDSGERAQSSIEAFDVLAAAERITQTTARYFAERDDAAAAGVETQLEALRQRFDTLAHVAPERVAEMSAHRDALADSFRRARASDVEILAEITAMRAVAADLRAAAATITNESNAELEAKNAELGAVELRLNEIGLLEIHSRQIGREISSFISDFAMALTPTAFDQEALIGQRLAAARQALTRIRATNNFDAISERHAAAVEALDALDARFAEFMAVLESPAVSFRAFRDSRAAVIDAAETLKRRLSILERDIQQAKRRQTQLMRASREAAAAALEASREGADFNSSTAAMEAAFLEFILTPSEDNYAEALGRMQPLIEFALTQHAGDSAVFADINAGVAAFDAGLDELHAAFGRRADALTAMTAASEEFFALAEAFGSTEMSASAAAAGDVSDLLIWSTATAAIFALFVSWGVARSITRPVRRITSQMKEVAAGDLDLTLTDAGRTDEIGEMATAVEVFRQNGLKVRAMAEHEKRRDAETEAARQKMMDELQDAFGGVVNAAALGDLDQRVAANFSDPELNAVATGMNRVLETVGGFFTDLKRSLDALAEGDLTDRIANAHRGAFQDMAESANTTVAKLAGLINEIRRASTGIAGSTREMADGARSLSERTESQATSLKQTAETLEEMRATVRSNAATAEEANTLASLTRTKAEEGGGVVGDAKDAMARLSGTASRITEIIGVIDAIAFQTNLLALNAAVEAARAGDSGKGFAVVASEVRALAQRSAEAAKDIKELIEESSRQVDDGVRLVDATRETLEEISSSISDVTERMDQISTATREQADSVQDVSEAVNALGALTAQNAQASERSAEAAHMFTVETDRLDELVSTFKLDPAASAANRVA